MQALALRSLLSGPLPNELLPVLQLVQRWRQALDMFSFVFVFGATRFLLVLQVLGLLHPCELLYSWID